MFTRGVVVAVLASAWVGCVCPGATPEAGDSGPPDTGVPDAGGFDAGDLDAGLLDAGGIDAGARDAGPEVCNGLDDDLDGLVDASPDGGPLTMACPLTLGVCAGAHSFCRDAGWSTCDYGLDYQLTERRCDGLDNDCDGRVDRSWARELRGNDAGRPNSILDRRHVIARGNSVLLVSPSDVITLDLDLLEQGRVTFADHYGVDTWLLPLGEGWVRIFQDFEGYLPGDARPPRACVTSHAIAVDGGMALESDGGLADVHRACMPGYESYLAVLPVDGGWFTVQSHGVVLAWGQPRLRGWAFFGVDGGVTNGVLDAGPFMGDGGPFATEDLVYAGRAHFDAVSFASGQNGPSEVSRLDPSGPSMASVATLPDRTCFPTATRRDGWACQRQVGQQVRSTLIAADGGAVVPEFLGWPVFAPTPQEHLYFRLEDTALRGVFDGGVWVAMPNPMALATWADGGFTPFADFLVRASFAELSVEDIAPGLVLVTYSGPIASADFPWGSTFELFGEYACVPH